MGSSGRSSMRRQAGESVSRRVSNSADVGKPGQNRYERPVASRESDEAAVDLANFRAISLTVSTFFKQVSLCALLFNV